MSFQVPDTISPHITLYYHKERKHSSFFSRIISLLACIAIIVLSLLFLYDFFSRAIPNAFYYNKFINDTGIFYLNQSGIFHSILLNNYTSYDKKAITVIGLANTLGIAYLKQPNPEFYDHWIYDICDVDAFPKRIKEDIQSKIEKFKGGLCISKFYNKTTKEVIDINNNKFEYPKLAHGSANPLVEYYGVIIQKCQNNSINNNTCYSTEETDENIRYLKGYNFYFVDQTIDVDNYHNPYSQYFPEASSVLAQNSFTINNLNFYPVTVRTHIGLLFDSIKENVSYKYVQNEKATYDAQRSGIIGSVYLWMPNRIEVYERSYEKLQDLAASIGGVTKLIMIIAEMINFLYHDFVVLNDFNFEMYRIKQKNNDTVNNTLSRINSNLSSSLFIKDHRSSKNLSELISINNYMKTAPDKGDIKPTVQTTSSNKKLIKVQYKRISFFSFLPFRLNIQKNIIYKRLFELRTKLLSEEMFCKKHNNIKQIKKCLLRSSSILSGQHYNSTVNNKIKIQHDNSITN